MHINGNYIIVIVILLGIRPGLVSRGRSEVTGAGSVGSGSATQTALISAAFTNIGARRAGSIENVPAIHRRREG